MTLMNVKRALDDLMNRKLATVGKCGKCMCTNMILLLTMIAVIIGALAGFMLRALNLSANAILLISFPGEIMMNMLKMLILPLIVSSLIAGLARLGARSSGKMGVVTLIYFLSTSIIAGLTGIAMVLLVHPGDPKMKEFMPTDSPARDVSILDTLLDLIRNVFPDNVIQAAFRQVQTGYVRKELPQQLMANISAEGLRDIAMVNGTAWKVARILEYKPGTNILGVITFCIAFGAALAQLGEKGKVLVDFFTAVDGVTMKLIRIVMWFSPIGIMCLIAGKILGMDDVLKTMQQLALYMSAVLGGFAVHGLFTLPLIYYVCTRKNPLTFFKGTLQACITALGTASSAATLPTTFRCVEENNGIDRRVSGFVLPIGTTVNMDGGALFEAVAAIFIAQVNGIHLDFGQVATVSLTATLASIGNAAIPNAALVTMILVLTAVGLPTADISLIVAVDWLLDRFRTAVNVMGDAFGTGIVQHFCQRELLLNEGHDSPDGKSDSASGMVEQELLPLKSSKENIEYKPVRNNHDEIRLDVETNALLA